jgi:hypothetical protein
MRAIAIGIVSVALLSPALAAEQPAVANISCMQAVQALQNEWHAVGYPVPTTQTQASLPSLDGQHHASAAEINNARLRIRLAHQECDNGDPAASLQHVAAVRAMIEAPTTIAATRQGQ